MGFWDENVNPITMLPAPIFSRLDERKLSPKKGYYASAALLKKMTSSKDLISMLGVGAKKLKSLFRSIKVEPRYNLGITYYPTDKIDDIKDLLLETKPEIDKSDYISNQELMRMFNFTDFKAWDISVKEKLVKKKFNGNVLHYQKEKAIEAFSKYEKKQI